jgi:glutamate racemase
VIGVLDWGVGGLGLVRALADQSPDVLYVSDAGTVPYGRQGSAELALRVTQVAGFLAGQGAERVVVACNAASTVLAQVHSPVPISGVIEPGVRAALQVPGRLGVIGGVRTIQSHAYGRLLRAQGRAVRERVAQPLSALVEAGQLDGPTVEAAVRRVLRPMGRLDGLVLACTHYPALRPVFDRVRPGLICIDPVAQLITELGPQHGSGTLRVWTSGPARATVESARAAWGLALPTPETLEIRC